MSSGQWIDFKSDIYNDSSHVTAYTGVYRDSACTQQIDFENLTNAEINALAGKTIYCGWESAGIIK